MDDDTAYMELVKANNQGELLALEIGIHALEMVGKAQGKKTKGDGLAGYASEIGKSQQNLAQWVGGAKVYQSLDNKTSCELNEKPVYLPRLSGFFYACLFLLLQILQFFFSLTQFKKVRKPAKSANFFYFYGKCVLN